MQADLRPKLPHSPSDLDEAESEGVELHPADSALDQFSPQGVHQPIRHRVQEQSELVGDEAVATEAIGFYVELEVLYPVLSFSPFGVELVEVFRLASSRTHDEAPVG